MKLIFEAILKRSTLSFHQLHLTSVSNIFLPLNEIKSITCKPSRLITASSVSGTSITFSSKLFKCSQNVNYDNYFGNVDGKGRFKRWWFQHWCRYARGCLWLGGWPELWPLWAGSCSCRGSHDFVPQSDCLPAASADSEGTRSTKHKIHFLFQDLTSKPGFVRGVLKDLVTPTVDVVEYNLYLKLHTSKFLKIDRSNPERATAGHCLVCSLSFCYFLNFR